MLSSVWAGYWARTDKVIFCEHVGRYRVVGIWHNKRYQYLILKVCTLHLNNSINNSKLEQLRMFFWISKKYIIISSLNLNILHNNLSKLLTGIIVQFPLVFLEYFQEQYQKYMFLCTSNQKDNLNPTQFLLSHNFPNKYSTNWSMVSTKKLWQWLQLMENSIDSDYNLLEGIHKTIHNNSKNFLCPNCLRSVISICNSIDNVYPVNWN